MWTRILLAVALFAIVTATNALAQDYPTKPVSIVVPFPPGGPSDVLARNLGVAMGGALKQQVIVENSGGAGGTIGINKAAKAKPDGYTILLMHIGMSTAPALYRKLPYDPIGDFEPIGLVADVPMVLVARKTLPPNNFKEFLAYAKANKNKLTYGTAGLGSSSHLCGMLFMSAIETEFTTVSYKGNAPALSDLVGGQIDLMCDQASTTTSQISAGTIKVYGVTSKARIASLSNVPTLNELGLREFEVVIWNGLYAPKGTPKAALDKLVLALQSALTDSSFRSRLSELGAEPVPAEKARPEALRTLLKSEIERWGPIIKKLGVYAD